jgi:hypothetical protein
VAIASVRVGSRPLLPGFGCNDGCDDGNWATDVAEEGEEEVEEEGGKEGEPSRWVCWSQGRLGSGGAELRDGGSGVVMVDCGGQTG